MLLSATLLACPLPAMANTITGSLSVFPVSENYPGTGAIEFGVGNALAPIATGDFAGIITNSTLLIPQNVGDEIFYGQIGSGSNLFCGPFTPDMGACPSGGGVGISPGRVKR
jgi:hypothetical protein